MTSIIVSCLLIVISSNLLAESAAIECRKDTDCADNLTCFGGNCSDLCSPHQCAENADCVTVNHQIVCMCREGFSGDGSIECVNFFINGKVDSDQYCSWDDKEAQNCRRIPIFYIVDETINSEDYKIDPKFKDLSVEGVEITAELKANNPDINFLPKFDEIFPNLVTFKATKLSLGKIDEKSLRNFRKLETLQLQENLIAGVEATAFDDLTELKYLDLSGNSLSHLSESLLQKNELLEFIDLSRNKLTKLSIKLLANQHNLRHFRAGRNEITEIDAKFFISNRKLERIDLGMNNLTEISFENQSELTHLYLNHNKIASIDENFLRNCQKLEKIRLNSNDILSLASRAFDNLPELTRIRLDFNRIEIVDETFLQNSLKIEKVFLSHNRIRLMSAKIVGNKTNLKYLGLSGNACIDNYFGFRVSLDPMTEKERSEAEEEIAVSCS